MSPRPPGRERINDERRTHDEPGSRSASSVHRDRPAGRSRWGPSWPTIPSGHSLPAAVGLQRDHVGQPGEAAMHTGRFPNQTRRSDRVLFLWASGPRSPCCRARGGGEAWPRSERPLGLWRPPGASEARHASLDVGVLDATNGSDFPAGDPRVEVGASHSPVPHPAEGRELAPTDRVPHDPKRRGRKASGLRKRHEGIIARFAVGVAGRFPRQTRESLGGVGQGPQSRGPHGARSGRAGRPPPSAISSAAADAKGVSSETRIACAGSRPARARPTRT